MKKNGGGLKMSEKHKDNSITASVIVAVVGAVVSAVVGGMFTIVAAIIGNNQDNQIEVIDVTGYSVSSAIQTLAENQLQYKIADSIEFDSDCIIIDQSIKPGTYVSKGTTIILTVNTDGNSDIGDSEDISIGFQSDVSTQISEISSPESTDYSIAVSYNIIPEMQYLMQYHLGLNENVRITATTSRKATKVKITIEPAVYQKEYGMDSSNQIDWSFKACFDTDGTYIVTAVAYFEDGITKSDSFSITYPFDY